MEKKINLEPLAKFLTADGYSSDEVSVLFDELSFDYSRIIIELLQAKVSPRSIPHAKTHLFVYFLRDLRDVFKQCSF